MTGLNNSPYICIPSSGKRELKNSVQFIQMVETRRVPTLYYQFPANSAFPTKIELESIHQNF